MFSPHTTLPTVVIILSKNSGGEESVDRNQLEPMNAKNVIAVCADWFKCMLKYALSLNSYRVENYSAFILNHNYFLLSAVNSEVLARIILKKLAKTGIFASKTG